MERTVLRGLLYVVLAWSCLAFVFAAPLGDREQAKKEVGFVAIVAVAALAVSARDENSLAPAAKPTTGPPPAAVAGRPEAGAALRRNS